MNRFIKIQLAGCQLVFLAAVHAVLDIIQKLQGHAQCLQALILLKAVIGGFKQAFQA